MNIYTFLVIALISCNSHKRNVQMSNVYRDIDLPNLKGIDRIDEKSLSFPFILIDSINKNERLIEYHLNVDTKYTRLYFYQDEYWKCEYVLRDADEYYYEYIFPGDTIVTLIYKGNPKEKEEFDLLTLKVLTNKKRVTYIYDDTIKVLPTNDYKRLINESVSKLADASFYNRNNIFQIEEVLKDYKTNVVVATNKTCYNVGDKSFFWWAYFGSPSQIVTCQ